MASLYYQKLRYSNISVIISITQRLMGVSFRKSPRPSLPLKRAPPLTPSLSPSGEREETAPPRRSEPLRSKVGGASKPSPDIVRDGTAWEIAVYS